MQHDLQHLQNPVQTRGAWVTGVACRRTVPPHVHRLQALVSAARALLNRSNGQLAAGAARQARGPQRRFFTGLREEVPSDPQAQVRVVGC